MKHLCLDARMINSAGIGTYIKSLLSMIKDQKNIFLTLLHWKQDEGTLLTFPHHQRICLASPIYSLKEQGELFYKIPPCDLFWSPHFNIPLLPLRAKKRLATIHDVYHLEYAKQLTVLQKAYAKIMLHSSLFLSDTVVTVSQFSFREISKYSLFKPKNLKVIYSGLCIDKFQQERKSSLRLPENYILYVGNIKPHKNVRRLLLAYAEVFPKEHLMIVGKKEGFLTGDSLGDIFKKFPKLNEKVHFTGYVHDEDIPYIYQKATLLVFPSLYEGFGFPPLEAMASGCPVVASSSASIPEICEDAVEYIQPLDIHSIAVGMKRVLKNPVRRRELIEKGYNQVMKFSMERSRNTYLQLINALMETT